MLNITPATAAAATAKTADADAAQAATRPLAGFGAGAFAREGAWAGSRATEMTAALVLPRIKSAIGAIGSGEAQPGFAGAACMTSLADVAQVDSVQLATHNYIQMTRVYPVIPGGVGPQPAREPVPV